MAEISFDRVVDLLKARGISAYVEQTGGGCASIYAGAIRYNADGDPDYAAIAGPGRFEGPGWTDGRGDTEDLYVGPTGENDDHFIDVRGYSVTTEEEVATLIALQAEQDDVTTTPT